ncbi:sunset domain-containing protein [Mesorhizobium huakuii]|uniref:sunset domain-containing protein n=1 Tax=Mesorhizobium huakuii TaxID=28104 RepID=UPI001FD48569|nr:hypothetical protein [Mesorhizobium huakuii]
MGDGLARYSNGKYANQQEAAKADRLGIWAGTVQPPWEWRAEGRKNLPSQPAPLVGVTSGGAKSCNIKGNISTTGERIYHVPSQQNYEKTKITEDTGERWFCSEAEAQAAGWRAAKR